MAASEIALTRLSLVRAMAIAEEGRRGAKRMVKMLRDPARYLNTILLLTLVCGNGAAVLSASLSERLFGNFALTIAAVLITILTFVFAEVIPKTYALQHYERVATITFPVTWALTQLVSPLSKGLIRFANWIAPGKGMKEGPFFSEAEIRQMVEIAGAEESIEAEEQRMIHSVFEFNDTVVREVMVPRPDMVTIDMNAPLEDALELVVTHGYSRIPAYRGDIDHIEGIVYAKDILARLYRNGKATKAGDLVRPAEFVPELKRISELLREMQQRKFHMAIVFDEHGGVTGLVTLEDLIEEIVGEIVDEYDTEEPTLVVVDEATLRVHGRLSVDDASEALGTALPEGDWDTVGGLVVGILGRVPEVNEKVAADGFEFVAEAVEGHRILSVLIHRTATDEERQAAETG